ncbi:MAG: sigma 54-interacting transcriptional regulator, partial [Bdellovibrionota bacterium]
MITNLNVSQTARILICDDDALFAMSVKHALKDRYLFHTARNGDEALLLLKKHSVDLIILDVEMRTQDEGLRFLTRFREEQADVVVVMSSGRTDFETVREALRRGADDYVAKNFENMELEITLERALEKGRQRNLARQRNFETKITSQLHHPMIGKSPAIERVRKLLTKVQASRANVLITGETGTGKEVVARQLRGTLPDGTLAPFVAIDSSTIQSTMAESILFGHEKGAFTGADKPMRGIFEEANGGTVYFDELDN